MVNLIVILIVALIVLGNIFYLLRAKKRGKSCIGCPYAKNCHAAKQQAAMLTAQTVSESKSTQCSGNCCECCGKQKGTDCKK